MQITLDVNEIQEALTNYVSEDFDISNKEVFIKMIAGRGKKGHSAVIDILPKGTAPAAESKKASKSKDKEAEETDAKTPAINFNDKE